MIGAQDVPVRIQGNFARSRRAIQWQMFRLASRVDDGHTCRDTALGRRFWSARTSRDSAENGGFASGILGRHHELQDRAISGLIFDAEGWPSGRWRWS